MEVQQALDRLRMECSKVERCRAQVMKRLIRWRDSDIKGGSAGFTGEEMDSIVESLVQERYIDDFRFAGAYVRDKARFSKWGKVKISYNLKKLGISDTIVSKVMAENASLFGDDVLDILLEKKRKELKESDSPLVKKQKLLRFALGRGFEYDQILPKIKDLG